MKKTAIAVLAAVTLTVAVERSEAAGISYAAGEWNDDAVVLLDSAFNEVRRFSVGAGLSNPNGVAYDGTYIYSGHFSQSTVAAYDTNGVEQFRWTGPIANLQGLTSFGDEIAVSNNPNIAFFDALTGAPTRSFPNGGSVGNIEGIATDGTTIFASGATQIGLYDGDTGAFNGSFANASSGCSFGGTGITYNADGNLALACTNGSWWTVSSIDGSVISSGNNGLNMYGITAVAISAIPVPAALPLLLSGLGVLAFARRRA